MLRPAVANERSPEGSMMTTTRAVFSSRRRSEESDTPTLTLLVTFARAPSIELRSVVAAVTAAIRRADPTTVTVDGSTVV